MESPLGSPVIADASRHGLQRSHTRAAISMGQDVGSLTDARHKQDSTAKSFNSLMTLQASEAEKEAQRKKYNDQASMYRAQIERQRRCTLDPHGRWMSRWDMLTSLALLFTPSPIARQGSQAKILPADMGDSSDSDLDTMRA